MNVTLRQLRALVAVAETGGFTAAARRLHLTPSALSLLVKELEAGVGARLFDRSTRHTQLTAAGEEFEPLARRLLADLHGAVEGVRALQQKRRGTVRIACTQLYAATLLPGLIAQYRAQYPGIDVLMLDSLNLQALQRVASGEADFGIAPQRPTPPELQQQEIYRDRIGLFCTPEHPLAERRSVSWGQVLAHPFVSLTQDFTARLQADLLRHSPRLQLQPVHSVSFVTTALAMVKSGHGITAQPVQAAPLAAQLGLVGRRITGPVVHRRLSLYTRREGSLSPAAESLRDYLVQAMPEVKAVEPG